MRDWGALTGGGWYTIFNRERLGIIDFFFLFFFVSVEFSYICRIWFFNTTTPSWKCAHIIHSGDSSLSKSLVDARMYISVFSRPPPSPLPQGPPVSVPLGLEGLHGMTSRTCGLCTTPLNSESSIRNRIRSTSLRTGIHSTHGVGIPQEC